MTIAYRVAHMTDVPALVGLVGQLGYSTTDVALAEVIRKIRQSHGEVFVAELADSAVGCINTIIDVRLAEGSVGEIASLVVAAPYRGKGIGKGLLQHAEEWLRPRVGAIRIRANVKRGDAHHFYALAGYTEIKEQKVLIKNV